MRLRHCVFLLLVLLGATPAHAALTCTLTAPGMNFGSISTIPIPQTDVNPNLTINCTGGTAGATVRMCVGINAGTGTGSALPNRFMNSGVNTIQYQIYFDAGHAAVWGDAAAGTLREPLPSVVLGAGGNGSQTYPMYGRIPNPPAQTKPTGTYTSTLQFVGKIPPGGSACTSGSGTPFNGGTFVAQVGVTATCTIAAASINFGSLNSLSALVNGAGSLAVTCSSGLPYSIAMNTGSTAGNTIAARKMSLNGAGPGVVSYQLYRDAGPTNLWGDGVTGVVYAGSGTGSLQTVPVRAQVPAQATPVPGTYQDTVRATITY